MGGLCGHAYENRHVTLCDRSLSEAGRFYKERTIIVDAYTFKGPQRLHSVCWQVGHNLLSRNSSETETSHTFMNHYFYFPDSIQGPILQPDVSKNGLGTSVSQSDMHFLGRETTWFLAGRSSGCLRGSGTSACLKRPPTQRSP